MVSSDSKLQRIFRNPEIRQDSKLVILIPRRKHQYKLNMPPDCAACPAVLFSDFFLRQVLEVIQKDRLRIQSWKIPLSSIMGKGGSTFCCRPLITHQQGQAGLSTVGVAHLLAVDWLGWICYFCFFFKQERKLQIAVAHCSTPIELSINKS